MELEINWKEKDSKIFKNKIYTLCQISVMRENKAGEGG
jgi:hypothetical protein